MQGGQLFRCETKACALSCPGRPLPKIKAHCHVCNGEDHPRGCAGKLLDSSTCNLYEFRLGKTPYRRRPTPAQLEKLVGAGVKFRISPGEKGASMPAGSTIAPGTSE